MNLALPVSLWSDIFTSWYYVVGRIYMWAFGECAAVKLLAANQLDM